MIKGTMKFDLCLQEWDYAVLTVADPLTTLLDLSAMVRWDPHTPDYVKTRLHIYTFLRIYLLKLKLQRQGALVRHIFRQLTFA